MTHLMATLEADINFLLLLLETFGKGTFSPEAVCQKFNHTPQEDDYKEMVGHLSRLEENGWIKKLNGSAYLAITEDGENAILAL